MFFFVISGYIMARICDGNPSYFLRRRLIRIVPPYWAVTLLLFSAAVLKPTLFTSTRANWAELVKSLFFLPFIKESGLYRPILFMGWSLNFEMFLSRDQRGASAFTPPGKHAGFGCRDCGADLVLAVRAQHARSRFLFRSRDAGVPLGVLAYFVAKGVRQETAVRIRVGTTVFAVGALLSLVLGQAFAVYWPLPGWTRVSLSSFVLVCSAALMSKGEWDTRLASVVMIGDASYILYLLHPYIIYPIGRVMAAHFPLGNITHLPGSLFAGAVAVLVAVWAHLKLELPTVDYLNARFGGHRRSTEFKSSS